MKIFNNTDEMDDVDSWLAGVDYHRDNYGQIVIYTGLFEWSDGSIHDEPEEKELNPHYSPKCPLCGAKLILVSISCGKNPGRKYRCPNYRCGWENQK